MSFREFAEKAWTLPDNCFDNHYPCQLHGVGMCDEWPYIAFPNKEYSNGDFSGIFEENIYWGCDLASEHEENMVICVESYIGEVGANEGVKLEEQCLVTKNGLQILTSLPLDLI